jgi:hypothetical protein
MNSAAEWVASIPDELTAREALVYVQQALDDAKAAEQEIVDRYKGGTLPPPPWPKHPQLQAAIDQMEGGRLLLNQAINLNHGDDKVKKTDTRIAAPLLKAGRNLYREIGVMQNNLKGVDAKDLPALAMKAARPLIPFAGATVMWLAIGWAAWEMSKEARRGRSIFDW